VQPACYLSHSAGAASCSTPPNSVTTHSSDFRPTLLRSRSGAALSPVPPPEQHGPSTRLVETRAPVVMETGHPSTQVVKTGLYSCDYHSPSACLSKDYFLLARCVQWRFKPLTQDCATSSPNPFTHRAYIFTIQGEMDYFTTTVVYREVISDCNGEIIFKLSYRQKCSTTFYGQQ